MIKGLKFEVGDRVRVIAPGEFEGHAGVISRVYRQRKYTRTYYRIVFDNHPWQKHGVDWAFDEEELEEEEKHNDRS